MSFTFCSSLVAPESSGAPAGVFSSACFTGVCFAGDFFAGGFLTGVFLPLF
jgi:hypothetical protein